MNEFIKWQEECLSKLNKIDCQEKLRIFLRTEVKFLGYMYFHLAIKQPVPFNRPITIHITNYVDTTNAVSVNVIDELSEHVTAKVIINGGVSLSLSAFNINKKYGNVKLIKEVYLKTMLELISSSKIILATVFHVYNIPELSNREKDVLRWLADGKTAWETSVILNVSVNTIQFHIKRIRTKFGLSSTTQIICIAAIYGLI